MRFLTNLEKQDGLEEVIAAAVVAAGIEGKIEYRNYSQQGTPYFDSIYVSIWAADNAGDLGDFWDEFHRLYNEKFEKR